MKMIIDFIKKETVLAAACALAVISAFIVPPDSEYADYIDFRTLGILFCLMAVVAGMRRLGLFELLSQKLLEKATNIRQLILILLLLCFVPSMFITNDVALITFVPFAFTLLDMAGEKFRKKWIMPIVVIQTVAANQGQPKVAYVRAAFRVKPPCRPQNYPLFCRVRNCIFVSAGIRQGNAHGNTRITGSQQCSGCIAVIGIYK